jgi:hypothetical protein
MHQARRDALIRTFGDLGDAPDINSEVEALEFDDDGFACDPENPGNGNRLREIEAGIKSLRALQGLMKDGEWEAFRVILDFVADLRTDVQELIDGPDDDAERFPLYPY